MLQVDGGTQRVNDCVEQYTIGQLLVLSISAARGASSRWANSLTEFLN
jgi:hypothetical protein